MLQTNMARTDFSTPRLQLDDDLALGATIALSGEAANYLINVLRLSAGDRVLVFNGRDGEFAGVLQGERKRAALRLTQMTRAQEFAPPVELWFAPLKHARLDYMAQKAVEMGAGVLRPILTRRTQVTRLNLERLEANAREACEQCGVIWRPVVHEPVALPKALAALAPERLLVFCDEDAPLGLSLTGEAPGGVALLIGPEGGFDEEERALILRRPGTLRLSLGPRILRADTAAVAGLAIIQARFGDWG